MTDGDKARVRRRLSTRERREQLLSVGARLFSDDPYDDVWVQPQDHPRNQEFTHGERETLLNYLDAYRKTLVMKCEGLTPEQLATASVPPSNLTLVGLVRHMAAVEQSWFRRVMGRNLDLPRLYGKLEDRDADFTGVEPAQECVDEAFASLAREVAPRMITIGSSLNLHPHPVSAIREIADEVGARVLYDAAHVCGLIAGRAWQQPLTEGAHLLTFSTYKSLGGPSGGVILTDDPELAQRLDAIAAESKRLSDAMARLDMRLARQEERLHAQFAALESLLSRSQAQSEWLNGQLAAFYA